MRQTFAYRGTAPATEAAGTVTLNGVAFDTAKTYIVPLTLKNAHNLEQDSAAVACPGKFGTLTFDADGTPKISTNLRSVTVGTLTDYAYDFKIYQGTKPSGETVAADIVAAQTVGKADGNGNHEVPETISFAIPKDAYNTTGVYLSMYVDAMGYAPDAYLQIDYAGAKESGDPSLNFTTEISTAEVEQFGNYNVTSQVTVKDGRITDVALAGNDFKGTHADDNQMYLNKAHQWSWQHKGYEGKAYRPLYERCPEAQRSGYCFRSNLFFQRHKERHHECPWRKDRAGGDPGCPRQKNRHQDFTTSR